MAKILNRCKPCGEFIFDTQRWHHVGKRGRIQHYRCRDKQSLPTKVFNRIKSAFSPPVVCAGHRSARRAA